MAQYGLFDLSDYSETPSIFQGGKTYTCFSCGLLSKASTKKLPPYGNFAKSIACVQRMPLSPTKEGSPWDSWNSELVVDELNRLGVSLKEDCLSFNAINCDVQKKTDVTDNELSCCRVQMVLPILEKYKPKLALLFGPEAVSSICYYDSDRVSLSLSTMRGWQIPDQKYKMWICPMFDPHFVREKEHRPEVLTIWRNDLKNAINTLEKSFPNYSDFKKYITILPDDTAVENVLERIVRREEGDLVAFDYETTGINPQAAGHKIVAISVCTERGAYAFATSFSERAKKLWARFLRSPNIKKISHNLKFEDTWSLETLGVEVRGWHWDSMLAAHILDNRVGITRLKIQTYLNFGIIGYDNEISNWLKSENNRDSNAFNKIEEGIQKLGINPFLTYCAADSLFCYWLAKKQMEQIGV